MPITSCLSESSLWRKTGRKVHCGTIPLPNRLCSLPHQLQYSDIQEHEAAASSSKEHGETPRCRLIDQPSTPIVGSQQGTEPLTQSTLAGDQTMELAPSRRPLKLDPRQREMATHLNALGFEKYPVYIRGDTNSHAAIIVRKERKSFEEGWAVLWHWARGFEV
jgi:hypothetical protein